MSTFPPRLGRLTSPPAQPSTGCGYQIARRMISSALCGYLGESDADGCRRLFTDPTLTSWVDIVEEAIRYRWRVPGEQGGYGGRSVVWVDNGVPLVEGEVTIANAESDFLSGPWSSQMLI